MCRVRPGEHNYDAYVGALDKVGDQVGFSVVVKCMDTTLLRGCLKTVRNNTRVRTVISMNLI